jgi:Flp pilus assembly protein TadG
MNRDQRQPIRKWNPVHRIARLIGRFGANRSGATAISFGVLLVPLLAAVGLSIDGSRMLLTRFHLQSAVDASALAVATIYEDETTLEALATKFVQKNFTLSDTTLGTVTFTDNGDTVTVTGAASADTLFMSIMNVNEINVGVSTTVKRAGGGLLVSLVLDNTGSMWGGSPSKIESLRSAADILVDAIFDGDTEPDDLRVAVVPYAAMVNPGAEADSIVGPHSHGARNASDKTKWMGCVMERAGADSIADTPPSTATWEPFWHEPAVDNDWDPADPNTIIPGGITNTNGVAGPNAGCPTPILPLTNSYANVGSSIDDLSAWNRGGTLGDIGMAWGIRTLSPGEPFDESTEIDPKTGATLWDSPRWRKAIVVMTDGDNLFYDLPSNSGPNSPHPGNSDYTAYGRLGESQADAIFGTSSASTAKGIVDTRFKALCTAAKDQDVIVFAVTFGSSPSASTKQVFQDCATDLGKYFHAPGKSTLESAFGAIGAELSKLRIVS